MEGFGDEVECTVDVHVSVDPVTGRNPGYCFIDLKTDSGAQTALESLTDISIQGRPVHGRAIQPSVILAMKELSKDPMWQSITSIRSEKQTCQLECTSENWPG